MEKRNDNKTLKTVLIFNLVLAVSSTLMCHDIKKINK